MRDTYAISGPTVPSPTSETALRNAINVRLRSPLPFEFWMPAFNKERNEVVVFIIHNGNALFIEDGYDLFPSDALITKLRMMG